MKAGRRAALLALAGISPALRAAPQASASELVFGQVAQLADPMAVGAQMQRGTLLYFERINRAGGVNGRALRLVARDRSGDAADAVRRTRVLIADVRPLALIGMSGTGSMEAVLRDKVLEREGLPVVGIRSGATSLHQQPWLFHTRASYRAEVVKIMRYLATLGVRRLALVHEVSAFGAEVQRLSQEVVASSGLTVVAAASVQTAKPDVARTVAAVAAARPEAVLTAVTSEVTAEFYKGLRGSGLSSHVIALSTVDGKHVAQRIGAAAARGLGIAQVTPDPANPSLAIAREFQQDLKAKGVSPIEATQAGLEGYLAAKVLVEGLRRAGPEPTRQKLRRALETISSFDVGGVIISFSPNEHSGSQYVDISILGGNGRMLR